MSLSSSRAGLVASIGFLVSIVGAQACGLNKEGFDFTGGSSGATASNPAGGGAQGGAGQGGAGPGGAGGEAGGAGAPPVCEGQETDCKDDAPGDWERVGYASDQATPCPSGFAEVDLATNPVLGADTCACDDDCVVTNQPSCAAGIIPTFYDAGDGKCSTVGLILSNSPAGGCNKFSPNGDGGQFSVHFKGTPPPPSGGSCSLTASPDEAQVQWTKGRICVPESEPCEFELCAGMTGFTECIRGGGDRECPSGFSTKHVVGDASGLACGACGCTIEAACEGSVEFYTDTNCTDGKLALAVDGTCLAVNSSAIYFRYKYIGNVASAKCAPQAPTAASFAPAQTICCK